jgi:electron transfer flavoprotein beta subunit
MPIHKDSFSIATQIAEVAKQGAYDLIFTGKETIDYNGSSIGGMVAELTGSTLPLPGNKI